MSHYLGLLSSQAGFIPSSQFRWPASPNPIAAQLRGEVYTFPYGPAYGDLNLHHSTEPRTLFFQRCVRMECDVHLWMSVLDHVALILVAFGETVVSHSCTKPEFKMTFENIA